MSDGPDGGDGPSAGVEAPARFGDAVVLVTGSTHGIGLGIARRFAREGARVVVNDAGGYDGAGVAADLREAGGEATFVEADVTDPDAVERLVDRTVEEYGRIDVLVNNAGGGTRGRPDDLTLDEWNDTLALSLRSGWLAVKHAVAHMPPGASVVNVSSRQGTETVPASFPYDVAKAGVDGLTRSLAVELGPLGIRVNAVAPGAIEVDDLPASDADLAQDPPIDPAERWGRPADVAGVVAFLAGPDAGYVTGVVVPVDGGRHAVLSGGQYAGSRRTDRE